MFTVLGFKQILNNIDQYIWYLMVIYEVNKLLMIIRLKSKRYD